ncbi:unnamed protein product, partial [Polarella glacialis]
MCRGSGMFNPTKIWRRWHRRVIVTQKRHDVVTALAASSLPPLVMARGHRIGEVAELPLVVSDGLESVQKTNQAVEALNKLGCGPELQKVLDSKRLHAGQGKARNRRFRMRLGPLVIYKEENGISRAMRSIPGVVTACVDSLNLLRLAPGGSIGRFIIWTEGAFKQASEIYGTEKGGAPLNTEIQSVLRPKLEAPKTFLAKSNPLKNKSVMARLNPGVLKRKELRKQSSEKGTAAYDQLQKKKKKKARVEASKAHNKTQKKGDLTFYKTLMAAFEAKAAEGKVVKKADEAEEE